MEVSRKTNSYHIISAPLLLSTQPKGMKMVCQKDTSTPMFIAETFTIPKILNPLTCLLIDEWNKKM
jgi:hypothetical protein